MHLKGKIRSVKDNKSAGSHGLAGEFYDIFQVYIAKFLLNVFKEAVEI